MVLENHCLHRITNRRNTIPKESFHRDDVKPNTSMVFDQNRLYQFYIPRIIIPKECPHIEDVIKEIYGPVGPEHLRCDDLRVHWDVIQ